MRTTDESAKLLDMDSHTLITVPTIDGLLSSNVMALFPVVDAIDTADEWIIDFAGGALVVHLGDQMEPRVTWVGTTEVLAGMTARSEEFPTIERAMRRAVELAGWAEAGA